MITGTWLSVSNWLIESNAGNLLFDGYVSRIPENAFKSQGGEYSSSAVPHDRTSVESIYRQLGAPRIDLNLISHAHFDHSWDTYDWLDLTQAELWASPTVFNQCGNPRGRLPKGKMLSASAGMELESGIRCFAALGNHAGDSERHVKGRQPRVLSTPIPAKDHRRLQRPGVLEDYPNGGGSYTFIIVIPTAGDEVVIAHTSSASNFDFDAEIKIGTESLGTPYDNINTIMKTAGISGVDVWLAPRLPSAHYALGSILNPRSIILHHWDSVFSAPGTTRPSEDDLKPVARVYDNQIPISFPKFCEPIPFT